MIKNKYILNGKRIAVFLFACLFFLMSGCSYGSYDNYPTTLPAETSQNNYYQPEEKGESAPLRIWWSKRNNFNPHFDNTLSGQAAYDLIFESLIKFNEQGEILLNLADNLEWSEDNLTLKITVKQNCLFHDGKELTAADVAQSLAYVWSENSGIEFRADSHSKIPGEDSDDDSEDTDTDNEDEDDQNNGEDLTEDEDEVSEEDSEDGDKDEDEDEDEEDNTIIFPQRETSEEVFASLAGISVVDRYTIECNFSQPVRTFFSYLDFPVIPANAWTIEDTDSEDSADQSEIISPNLIAGTGRFKMERIDDAGNLWLSLVNSDDKDSVNSVVLKQYGKINEAMRALEADELDLVLLDTDQYPLYHRRNNLDIVRYTGDRSVFLSVQTDSGFFSEVQNLFALKKNLQKDYLAQSSIIWPGELADVPISFKRAQIDHEAVRYASILNDIKKQLNLESDDFVNNVLNISEIPDNQETSQNEDSSDEDAEKENKKPANNFVTVKMIVPEIDYAVVSAENISVLLSDYINIEINVLPALEYMTALQSGDYELAWCEAKVPLISDPAWLYGPDGSVEEILWFDQAYLQGYNNFVLQLDKYHDLWHKPSETDKIEGTDYIGDYSMLLGNIAARSTFIHLSCNRQVAVK